MTKKTRLLLIIGASAAAAAIAATLLFLFLRGGLKEALKPEKYDRVMVTVVQTRKLTAPTAASSSEAQYEDEEPAQTDDDAKPEVLSVMKKDGDRIFEEGVGGKYYFYPRDGKKYVLYYDDMMGIYEKGYWVEAPAEQFSGKQGFTVSDLSKISPDEFVKKGDAYVPKGDRLAHVFFTLLGVTESSMPKYYNYDIQVKVRNNRIESILATYVFDYTYEITLEYKFAYEFPAITIPKTGQND